MLSAERSITMFHLKITIPQVQKQNVAYTKTKTESRLLYSRSHGRMDPVRLLNYIILITDALLCKQHFTFLNLI